MHRESGRQGVERPLTANTTSASIGDVSPLPAYKVYILFCVDKGPVLNITLASCPTPPDSCDESGRTDSGRGGLFLRSPISQYSFYIR